ATKGAPLSEPEPSVVGSFSAAPCPEDAGGERVCIPGGAFILGSQELFLVPDLPALPERVVQHERFWLDRHEVSVGRYRAALASGFVPPTPPNEQNQELGAAINQNCAFSA